MNNSNVSKNSEISYSTLKLFKKTYEENLAKIDELLLEKGNPEEVYEENIGSIVGQLFDKFHDEKRLESEKFQLTGICEGRLIAMTRDRENNKLNLTWDVWDHTFYSQEVTDTTNFDLHDKKFLKIMYALLGYQILAPEVTIYPEFELGKLLGRHVCMEVAVKPGTIKEREILYYWPWQHQKFTTPC